MSEREGEIVELQRLAAEQAALRRVAVLIARQVQAPEVFAVVTEELAGLLGLDMVWTVRFERDGSGTVLAALGGAEDRIPRGTNFPLPSGGVLERVSHGDVPSRVDDYAAVGGPTGSILRAEGVRCAAGGPIVVDGRVWGAMVAGARTPEALPAGSENRIAEFAELVSAAISNIESRAEVERLAAEQSALRRVAELVARQASSDVVFALVTEELSGLLGVEVVRTLKFEPASRATVVAARGRADDPMPPGTTLPVAPGGMLDQLLRTGRPTRFEDYSRIPGRTSAILHGEGTRCAAGGPIVVDGRLWGAMVATAANDESLPPGSEDRIARFAELVSTAISNIESRGKVERLAAEQAALRRVAELVARQAPPDDVFALVTEELSRLLEVNIVRTVRFEADGTATIVAAHGITDDRLTRGSNFAIPEGSVVEKVFRTGRPARVDDFANVRGPIGAILREQGARAGIGGPIVVDGRLWGAMAVGAPSAGAFPPGCEDRVAQFAELVSTAISNIESRARVERLAAEQSALRRVAELVARQAPPEQVFGLVTEELNRLLDVTTVGTGRFESDGTVTIMAVRGTAQDAFPPGASVALEGGSAIEQVFRTGLPAHVENYDNVGGQLGTVMRELGAGWAAAGPIVVDGRLWGAMTVNSGSAGTYPAGAEQRVAQFAELVSTAISNIESRAKIERLAAEQAALRRVATLVAREHSPEALFATLAEEVRVLLGVDASEILRYEGDGTATMVAGWSDSAISLPLGERLPLEGENLATDVLRTGVPGRREDYSEAPGAIAALSREVGIRSAVGCPILVEGETWGMIAVASRRPEPLPPDTEARLAEFSHQAGMAVANTKSRTDLAQSRARIVRTGDDARRRFERDLHDGAQQRLVSMGFELRAAEAAVPPEFDDVHRALGRLDAGLNDVVDDLRELSQGLHPAVLSEGGLVQALRALARRSAVPVDLRLEIDDTRLEEPIEVTAYYVTSEALTNTAKHAHALRVKIHAGQYDGSLELTVRDDGRGGADPSMGTGLTGLVDRVQAVGGTIHVDSPADAGTAIHVKLPIRTAT
jgi:GAF domain-containing protein